MKGIKSKDLISSTCHKLAKIILFLFTLYNKLFYFIIMPDFKCALIKDKSHNRLVKRLGLRVGCFGESCDQNHIRVICHRVLCDYTPQILVAAAYERFDQ